jgi:hypothetical protein
MWQDVRVVRERLEECAPEYFVDPENYPRYGGSTWHDTYWGQYTNATTGVTDWRELETPKCHVADWASSTFWCWEVSGSAKSAKSAKLHML